MNAASADIRTILDRIGKIVQKEMDSEYRLFLFGSRAKGDFAPRADIDIGILSRRPINSRVLANIREALEQIPTLLKIDFVDLSTVSEDFRDRAMSEKVEIHSG